MSLHGYELHQGYDELIMAHQAKIRRAIAEDHLARQARTSQSRNRHPRLMALLRRLWVRLWGQGHRQEVTQVRAAAAALSDRSGPLPTER